MGEVVSAQLRLRRAFRYGYFVFVAVVATLLALFALWAVSGGLAVTLARSVTASTAFVVGALGLGLSIPLFFAAWLLVGAAILGEVRQRSLLEGIRD